MTQTLVRREQQLEALRLGAMELWKRLETAAGEIDTTANRLLAALGERWLETRQRPQSEVRVQVARASIFTAQAIALDLIATGRQKRVDQLLEHAASIVSGVASEPLVEATTYAEECDTEGGNT